MSRAGRSTEPPDGAPDRGRSDDGPALLLDAAAQGSLKAITFDTPVGLRNCGKATASGLKAGKGQKAETKEGC